MRDRDIDDVLRDILRQAAEAPSDVDPALLDRISKTAGANLLPARAIPPAWITATGLALICGSVALAGAMGFGLLGIHRMSALEIGLIFSVLSILMVVASMSCVAEAIPGSRRLMAPRLLMVSSCLGLAAIFALLFHDYGTERFVAQGVKCLAAGLAYAVPASLATWWLLRWGFCVNVAAAGLARGTLAGLAGVTMLELHCPNFEAPHLLAWHIAVLPISAAVGMVAMERRARRS